MPYLSRSVVEVCDPHLNTFLHIHLGFINLYATVIWVYDSDEPPVYGPPVYGREGIRVGVLWIIENVPSHIGNWAVTRYMRERLGLKGR